MGGSYSSYVYFSKENVDRRTLMDPNQVPRVRGKSGRILLISIFRRPDGRRGL